MSREGQVVFEISSSRRNGEGAFLQLDDGRLMYAYSHCLRESYRDDDPSCIAVRYSTDKGHSWSDEEIIITPEKHDAKNVMSVSLLAMEQGELGLFYIIRYGWHDTRLHLQRSGDAAKTWSAPLCCVPAPGYFVTNNDRVVRLSTGRIVVPANYHRMRTEDVDDWVSFDSRGIALFYLSDDDGHTWREAQQFCTLSVPSSRSGLQETGVIELKSGVLWAWCRTDQGRQYEMYSMDMGETWTVPGPSMFRSPTSPLSMKRIPHNGFLFAVWNPMPCRDVGWPGKTNLSDRTPLVYAVSRDDGKTWGAPAVIEDDPQTGFSYVAIHFTDDTVLLAYFIEIFGDHGFKRVLRMREIPLADLTA